MEISALENVISFFVSIIGLLVCLFRYIETPRRGWLYLSLFYLSCLMSDYYWAIYYLVMRTNPEDSPTFASLGWNISCLFLYIIILRIRNPKTKKFFHPVMLISIPAFFGLFILCSRNGEIINDLWQCLAAAFVSFVTIKALAYWFINRKNGAHFPHFKTLLLVYIITQCGMWISSSYDQSNAKINPYYIFVFASFIPLLFFAEGMYRDFMAEGLKIPNKNSYEFRLQVILQAVVSLIIVGSCIGGYVTASIIRDTFPSNGEIGYTGAVVGVTLFSLSVFMVLMILTVIAVVAFRNKKKTDDKSGSYIEKRSKFNLVFTLLVTLILMTIIVAYNARLLFSASVEKIYAEGQEKAESNAKYLENYLQILESSLWTTADTVDMMIRKGETQDNIRDFLLEQTTNRKNQFDKDFTGMYGYIRGEYMDGTGWVPPEDYDPETRGWYQTAIDAGGEIKIVSPYIDAQTHQVVITVCKLLNDGLTDTREKRNIVALDMYVDHIQDTMQDQNIVGKGYGMIIDGEGMIIAHKDPEYNGKYLRDVYGDTLSDSVLNSGDEKVNALIDGEHCTLFISPVLGQWYVTVVISDSELFEELRSQIVVNILISLGIFALISLFYYLSYRNEQAYSKKMEELNISRQKQEYEAEVLRLEKLAADEANKAKGSFLADMSHEIRTPINAILGMNEMILREATDTGIREYAKNINTSGKNLLQLINSILDFSKIEDGKMEIVPVRYSVSEMITYLVNSILERARGKGLEFIVNADPAMPSELYGDDARINQVIMNLLTNAVKYTHEGSVTLTVEAAEKRDDELLLRVTVRDTGIGIKESEMGKLFESFERLDVVKNRNIEGTGLGMSITTRLLKLMNSELKVESTYGKGSVFSFDIWQKIENSTPLGDYKMLESADISADIYSEDFRAPGARILIVDDTRMNIIVATGLLKNAGMNIDTAMNGRDAVDLTDKNAYDVILLDQRMPGMDGTETLKAIRASEHGKNEKTPVICLTADAITGAKERYIAEGFTDYLTKPVNGHSLEQMLIKYLPKDKVSGGGAASSPLSESGIDTDAGLEAFNGDKEFYYSVLAEFALDHDERYNRLQDYYNKKDWNSYRISIHALKSSAKTIGALELSDIALGLEKASGEGDIEKIERDHKKALELYDNTVAAIKESVDIGKYAIPLDMEE
ncbi:MAG: response regulator [Lachnospiraceae bacterium]|nr:response regulator [Lachnospiraceae bacterium]